MRRPIRAAATVAFLLALMGMPAAAQADVVEPSPHSVKPSSNALELKVERMEHETKAEVVGVEENTMLFNTSDSAALAAAAEVAAKKRQAETSTLFDSPARPYWQPASPGELFNSASYSPSANVKSGTRDTVASAPGGISTFLLAAFAVSALFGAGVAYLVRERKLDRHGG